MAAGRSKRRSKRAWFAAGVAALWLVSAAGVAGATPVTLTFTAFVSGPDSLFGTDAVDGMPITGSYGFDSDAPPVLAFGGYAYYALTHFEIGFNGFVWNSDSGLLEIANDVGVDSYTVGVPDYSFTPGAHFEGPAIGSFEPLTLGSVVLNLAVFPPANPLSDTSLPLGPPGLPVFNATMNFSRESGSTVLIYLRDLQIVPEPGTAVLAALGLGMLGACRGSRRACPSPSASRSSGSSPDGSST